MCTKFEWNNNAFPLKIEPIQSIELLLFSKKISSHRVSIFGPIAMLNIFLLFGYFLKFLCFSFHLEFLTVARWLANLQLPMYEELLVSSGFDSLDYLVTASRINQP